jgi:Na+/melibiose symporter-like transporter
LAAARYVAGGAARLLLAAGFAPMMIGQPAPIQSNRFGVLCLGMALTAVVTASALRAFIQRRPHIEVRGERQDIQAGARAGKTAPLIALLAIAFTLSISGSLFGRLEPYFAAFAVRHVINAGIIMSAATAGSLLSQGIWVRVAQHLALTDLLRAALVVLAVGAGLFYLLAPLGVALSAAACVLYGIGSGGVHMSLWSLLAGRAAALTGAFTGTAAFGLFTCFSKLGLALAATAMGMILAGVDYRDQILAMGPIFLAMAAAPIAGALLIGLLTVSFPGRATILPSPRRA